MFRSRWPKLPCCDRVGTTRSELTVARSQADLIQKDLDQAHSENATNVEKIRDLELQLSDAQGAIHTLEARLEAFNLVYGLGRDRPVSVAVIILAAALVAAALIARAVVLGAIVG
jgi:hypothetical protein